MSKEWYVMNSPHSQLSGFESDAINDFAQEGFLESLDSEVAVDIELCNYDLSDCQQMRAVVLGRNQDTKLKSLERNILLPIGISKAGMYVKYKNRYWIIVGLVDDNVMFEKGTMVLCNYLLTWLNHDGNIIQRWANVSSASQYNSGEWNDRILITKSDQLMIIIPDDDESILLDSNNRFIIDKRCKVYEKSFSNIEDCDTSKNVITYKITRLDSVLYNYQDSGHQEFIVCQDEKHDDDGYYIVNGKGYWLCGIPNKNIPISNLSSSIECDSLEIYNDVDFGTFTAKFYDSNGKEVNIEPSWSINCNFVDQLCVEYINNSICISVNNKKLINKSFELLLSAIGYETVSKIITIRAFI